MIHPRSFPGRAARALVALVLIAGSGGVAAAIDTAHTRMLSQPALSPTHVAFIYGGDLYVADLEGRNVRRLTSDEGIERLPAFSPDGSQIAFSAEYDGNVDVFVVPVPGGVPRRLTWHPGAALGHGRPTRGRSALPTARGVASFVLRSRASATRISGPRMRR